MAVNFLRLTLCLDEFNEYVGRMWVGVDSADWWFSVNGINMWVVIKRVVGAVMGLWVK